MIVSVNMMELFTVVIVSANMMERTCSFIDLCMLMFAFELFSLVKNLISGPYNLLNLSLLLSTNTQAITSTLPFRPVLLV